MEQKNQTRTMESVMTLCKSSGGMEIRTSEIVWKGKSLGAMTCNQAKQVWS